ncbi:MAG: Glu/Leu/Phe/Val dehydrogenase dimerization domain-containing protein [Pseudomonadota bacterium]
MSVFDHPEFDDHESVHFFADAATGLRAIVAVHSTTLGPGAGGCRRWEYSATEDAVTDVLRLSRGMSYKNAVAGLAFGGGKSVILAAPDAPKSPELFRAFGRAIDSLGGRYVTAEDVGIAVEDMRTVREVTPYVTGVSDTGHGGDPSPFTALGVYLGLQAAVRERLNVDTVAGLTVAVQGVGHVGLNLCRLLHEAGAKLVIADVNPAYIDAAIDEFGPTVVAPEAILSTDCDVLAPCALGNILNSETIPQLRATVVAGAANNQLGVDSDGDSLRERGILYAPDYVINAGGIVAVAREYLGQADDDAIRKEIDGIATRLTTLFRNSASFGTSTNRLADELARSLIRSNGNDDTRLTA